MTTPYVLPRYPMTKKIHADLGAALGIPVGLNAVPKVSDGSGGLELAKAPYAIVYSLWRNLSGPMFGAAQVDAEWVYQVTLYGERGDQLELLMDKVFAFFIGKTDGHWTHPLDVDGLAVMDRVFKEDTGVDTGDPTSGTLDAVARFGILVTPAA